jgi:hypothetical protein
MVAVSEWGAAGGFHRAEAAVYREILQQARRNCDGFCIPPSRSRWLLSYPEKSKFAAKNRSNPDYHVGEEDGPPVRRPVPKG